MLYELSCDKFKNHGEIIHFKPGLNTIIGTVEGGNSIGKSTFLSIIDFVFGGNSYTERHTEIINAIGEHVFNFSFKFGEKIFYFSRGTSDSDIVISWDDSTHSTQHQLSLEAYKDFLSRNYEIPAGASIRGMLSRSFRIWYKSYGINSDKPLSVNVNDNASKTITDLIASFGEYDEIAEAKENADQVDKKLKALNKTPENEGVLLVAKNAAEVKANEERIKNLEMKADGLFVGMGVNANSIDASKIRQITPIRDEMEKLQKQKAQLESEIRIIEIRHSDKIETVDSDYKELLEFFPEANIASLKEIQSFHKGLYKILDHQYKERLESLQDALESVSVRIDELTSEIETIASESNISKTILKEYSSYQVEIDHMKLENSNFRHREELKVEHDKKKKAKEEVTEKIAKKIQNELNDKMKEISSAVKNGIESPSISIIGDNKYIFSTGNDKGTGATYRSVVILDLALLSLTNLPAVVHDSMFFNEIEKDVVEGIFRYYDQSSKQIFVAIDRHDVNSDVHRIAKCHEAINLGKGKDSLFGIEIR